ncbi:MAG: hypothetical protein JW794_04920, partial [Candidatus Cloacimonetes bacterium]|nr:hypothetical protein [Candidatus Cloacimonadota bacterium]
NNYLAFLLGKLYERFQKSHTFDFAKLFLKNNMEYVYDTLHSEGAKEFLYYDYSYIKEIVNEYYKGQTGFAKDVLWWLTFDVWRRTIQEKR